MTLVYKKKDSSKPGTNNEEIKNDGGNGNDGNGNSDNNNGSNYTVTKEEVHAIIRKLPGASTKTFDENIEAAKRGSTYDINFFMTNNNEVFGENLEQYEADTLCTYVREQTGLGYMITINKAYYDPTPETVTNYDLNSSYDYKDHKFILKGSIKASDNWGNAWDISPYLQIYDQDKDQWQGIWWDYAEVPVIHNGHYVLIIGLYGTNFLHRYEYDVTDVDSQKPHINSITQIEPTDDVIGNSMQIRVTDEGSGLKSIYIEYEKDKNKNWTINLNGEKEKVVEKTVGESGKYKIVVEDKAGNKEETTMEMKVDKNKPKPNGKPKVEVVGNSSVNTYNGMPIVKEGDKVKIYVTADKEIKSIGNPNNRGTGDGSIQLASGKYSYIYDHDMHNVNSLTIPVEIEITKDLIYELDLENKSGAVDLSLYYVRDKFNNQGEEINEYGGTNTYFKFDNVFYIDNNGAPTLAESEIKIKGNKGRIYTDKSNNDKAMIIEAGAEYIVDLTFDEELASDPILKIGNSEKEIKATYKSGKNTRKCCL